MRVTPMFAWYDLWVGVFVDKPKRRIYVFPLPCLGVRIDLTPRQRQEINGRTCAKSRVRQYRDCLGWVFAPARNQTK
jgi:hypothetical protein